jgi:hypothetical protein
LSGRTCVCPLAGISDNYKNSPYPSLVMGGKNLYPKITVVPKHPNRSMSLPEKRISPIIG